MPPPSAKPRKKYLYVAEDDFLGLPVNNYPGNLLKHRLQASFDVLATALTSVNRLLVVRVDLRLPVEWDDRYTDSKIIERFIQKLRKKWNSQKAKRGELHYIWCKEKAGSPHSHWHFVLLVDGKYTQPFFLYELTENVWERTIGQDQYKKGLVNHGYVKSCSKHEIREIKGIFNVMSYLCKHQKTQANERGMFRTSQSDDNARQFLLDSIEDELKMEAEWDDCPEPKELELDDW